MSESESGWCDQLVALLTAQQRPLFIYILSLVGDESQANDILQNTNQVLWKKRAEFVPHTNFTAWSNRIAYWQVMDFIKRRKLDRHLFDDELLEQVAEAVHETAESAGSRLDFLQQCMEELPQQLRAMVRRRYEPGVTIDQLAQQQGALGGGGFAGLASRAASFAAVHRRQTSHRRGTMNDDDQKSLEPLLAALVESRLTDEQHQELQSLLRASPATRAYFARYMFVHGALAWRKASPLSDAAAQGESQEIAQQEPAHARSAPPAKNLAKGVVRFLGRRVTYSSLVTAALVMAVLITAMALMVPPFYKSMVRSWQPTAAPVVTAKLTGLERAQWADGQIGALVGAHLVVGHRLDLRSGLAEVTYRNGAKVIVEGPAKLVITGENSSELSRGKIVAWVPPAAIGYTVTTPLARFVDLGTEFGVKAGADGSAEIHVFAGKVQAEVFSYDGRASTLRIFTANQKGKISALSRSFVESGSAKELFARAIEPQPLLLGSPLGNYGGVDTAAGVTLIFGGLARQGGTAETFEFYSVQPGRWVTPLVLAYDAASQTYRITGIGQSIESDGSGKQSSPFAAVAGSPQLEAGVHTFGMFDGRVESDAAGDVPTVSTNQGVISFHVTRGGRWLFAYKELPRHVQLGRTYSAGGEANELLGSGRTYAAQLGVQPPMPTATP